VARLEMENFHFDPAASRRIQFHASRLHGGHLRFALCGTQPCGPGGLCQVPRLLLPFPHGSEGKGRELDLATTSAPSSSARRGSWRWRAPANRRKRRRRWLGASRDGRLPEEHSRSTRTALTRRFPVLDFGVTWYLAFADVLKRTTATSMSCWLTTFSEQRPLRRNDARRRQRALHFRHTQPLSFGAAIGAWLGARYDQPLMRWLADNNLRLAARRKGEGREQPFFTNSRSSGAIRNRSEGEPALPAVSILESLQWGVLRSDGGPAPALELAVKGNPATASNTILRIPAASCCWPEESLLDRARILSG